MIPLDPWRLGHRPYARSRTERKRIARAVRQYMPLSREPAPHFGAILNAADRLGALLSWSTCGIYRLTIEKQDADGQWIEPSPQEQSADRKAWLDV